MTMKKLLQLFESEQVAEKAVSQQQQKFMGMVHAMQKGEKVKGASAELKKAAKTMGKKDAKDFASTKHKGLPKKVDESVMLEAGNNLEHIVTRFKHETKNFLNGNELDDDLYNALYDYYVDNGEMPYGVAKAREGDPYQWVGNRFEDALRIMGYERQFNETTIPVVDNQLSELARLAGLSESRVDECGDMGMDQDQHDSMNISTNMSSDGTKSVTISAQGEQAEALIQMLKLAGMSGSNRPAMVVASNNEEIMDETGRGGMPWVPDDGRFDDEVDIEDIYNPLLDEEDYANSPDEEYQSVDSIIHQGNDLNRKKRQYASKPRLGDNPMAESILDADLDAMLESILIRDDEITKDTETGRVKMTIPPPKRRDPASQELPLEPESPESRVTGPRTMKVGGERTGTENYGKDKEVDEGSIKKGGPNDLTGTWSSDPPEKGQPDVPPPVPMDPVYPNAKNINKPNAPAAPKSPASTALPRLGIKK